jgi:hypothetical protein
MANTHGEDKRREVRNESAVTFADHMKKVRSDAKAAWEQAAERMKQPYDKHARPTIKKNANWRQSLS